MGLNDSVGLGVSVSVVVGVNVFVGVLEGVYEFDGVCVGVIVVVGVLVGHAAGTQPILVMFIEIGYGEIPVPTPIGCEQEQKQV